MKFLSTANREMTDPQLQQVKSMEEIQGEIFHEIPVKSNEKQIGAVTIGISLEERNKSMASTGMATAMLSGP